MRTPTPLRPGQVGRCVNCGHEIAGRLTAKALGIRESGGLGRCLSCKGKHTRRRENPVAAESAVVDPWWRPRAACATPGVDRSAFELVEAPNQHGVPEAARYAAIRYCARCPVRPQCDAEAATNSDQGLWAGKFRDGIRVVDLLDRPWLGDARGEAS